MSTLRRVPDVLALRADHDAFLVDVWGVIHSGGPLHEGVHAALDALAESGARVLFLSNSSRLGALMAENLVALGVRRDVFVDVLSSGDVTREALAARDEAIFSICGASPRVLHVGHAAYVPWVFELGLDIVDDDDSAELIIATGAPATAPKLEAIRVRLAPLAARGVPLVCTNPDPVIPSPDGGVVLGPGAVARVYERLGGPTFLFGKPHPPIYREALSRLAVAPERVVAIGDMIATDIAGARGAGLASVLVTTGVHAPELAGAGAGAGVGAREAGDAALEALFAQHGSRPDAVLAAFGARR